MAKFLKKKQPLFARLSSKKKQNNDASARVAATPALAKMRKRIAWQAGLAGLTVVLTLVIVFAMTSAWYTNIVHTSGLTFEAEAWGFDGEIQVNEEVIVAGPGDEGVIHLEVANENDSVMAVSVGVSKSRMVTQMQQRLFFYVDTQQVRNGETVDRVYLNDQESYTYTLFSNGSLTLTEQVHNDAPLKWMWVYDMLGYYVLGMANDDNTDVTEIEYLRPIEYDYDEATTTFQEVQTTEEGSTETVTTIELVTVDGEKTVEEFLVELSQTDGYEGVIDPAQKLEAGYYPVDVDENGYGVYAYLCNYAEIEMATEFDTAIGMAAAEGEVLQYIAQLTISAQKNKDTAVNVSTLAALRTVLEDGNADVIQLSGNITIGSEDTLVIEEGTKCMLDLNGYTITSQSIYAAISVEEGGSLTMTNGTLAGTDGTSSYAVYSVGAEVLLSDVKIQDFEFGIYVSDEAVEAGLDSRVRLVNCELDTNDTAILVRGNGIQSEQPTMVIVEGCTINSDDIAICGNGSEDQSGTDIQIIGSQIISNPDVVAAGIYHPQQDGILTIYNSTVSGYTGMCIKGGTVTVVNSTVKGLGAVPYEPGSNASGFADTADAIYIEANYGYEIQLQISENSTLTSSVGQSLQVYEADADNVSVTIVSGTFDEEQPEEYIAEGSTQTVNAAGKNVVSIVPEESTDTTG